MKKLIYGVLIVIGIALIGALIYLNSVMTIITGYAAKNLCSNVFVSGRDARDIEAVDLNFSFIRYTKNKVDFNDKSVVSRFLWGRSKAIYREGFGATLVHKVPEEVLRNSVYPVDTNPGWLKDTTLWPLGEVVPDTVPAGIDKPALDEISRRIIEEGAYRGNVFAVLVLYKGIPVTEAYKTKFTKNTRLLSWSVAKSFTNALTGVLVKQGNMDLAQPLDIEEWKNDDRSRITLNDLLQMQSGLEWNEDYGSRSDVNLMLFREDDMSAFAISKSNIFPAGTHFNYSGGSANIVSNLIRKEFQSDTSYYAFAQDQLFEKIGITDAVFEVDASGDFIGSSYVYATARDYARFGLLYLNDGIFNGERILPEGWVKYTSTPASGSNGEYGAFFWLNRGGKYPSAPEDMFSCEGHDHQMIFIIPSKDMVVVVLGFSHKPDNAVDLDRLLKDILGTVEQ